MYAHLIVLKIALQPIGARFSSSPPGQTEELLLNLSKPKLSNIAFCARRDYFFRAEPLKIAKSASSSTPVAEQATSQNQQQNADQEVPRRTLNYRCQSANNSRHSREQ
jgi:hypothetical protein